MNKETIKTDIQDACIFARISYVRICYKIKSIGLKLKKYDFINQLCK